MPGLWINESEYVDFSNPDREALLSEIATRSSAMEVSGWLGALPDPDPVLRKSGDSVSVLDDLTADDQVCMAMQQRKLGTLGRACVLDPGAIAGRAPTADAVRVCEEMKRDIEDIDLFNLLSQILDAPYWGNTPIEIIWGSEGARMRILDLVPKPRRWFGFGDRGELLFRAGGIEEPVPFGKFAVARHFPTYENPYGLRLLSRCLWPVAFKRAGWQFFVTFAERFGSPWVIGKAGAGEDPDKMLQRLAAMVQYAVSVVKQGSDVTIAESSGKAGDVHPQLIKLADAAISKVLMLQTLTAELNDKGGSRAASETHRESLDDARIADAVLAKTALDEIAWLYTRVNAPGTISPVFSLLEPGETKKERSELDKTLKECGLTFKKIYFVRRYGYAEDEIDVVDPGAKGVGEKAGSADNEAEAEFAGGGRFTPEQEAIEALVDSVLPTGIKAMDGVKAGILSIIESSSSPDELMEAFHEAFQKLLGSGFDDVLAQALLAADIYGRFTVRREAANGR